MTRIHDLSRWGKFTEYASTEDFLLSAPRGGVHSIAIGPIWIDLLVEEQNSDVTLVVFHAAATKVAETIPIFTGVRLARDLGVNLISIADPTLAMGEIDLAWYLGNKYTGPLPDKIAPLIRHIGRTISSDRIVFFGSSGGGYAALVQAHNFPDSKVLLINPRLNISSPPKTNFARYLVVAHGASSARLAGRVVSRYVDPKRPAQLYSDGLPFDLFIFQNSGDRTYLRRQVRPFIEKFKDDPRLKAWAEYTGPGHQAAPGTKVRSMLRAIINGDPAKEFVSPTDFLLLDYSAPRPDKESSSWVHGSDWVRKLKHKTKKLLHFIKH